jgi:site-specific recombinase XerD
MKNNNQLSQPLDKLLAVYLYSRKTENLREATLNNYKFMLTAFMRFMLNNNVERVEDVTTMCIRDYMFSLYESGKAGSTVDAHYRCLATFFKWLHDNDYISGNPMLKVRKPKFDVKQKPVFSPSELEQMYLACQTDLENSLLFLMLDCGLRVSEAINLKIKNVDLQRKFIYLEDTKGRTDRTVGMGTATSNELKRMLKARRKATSEDDYLFVNRSGKQFTRYGLSQVFLRLKNRAGVETEGRLHGMRRTSLTTMARNGVDLPTLQKISGHKHVNTLIERYIGVDEESVRNAVREKGAVNTILLKK